MTSNPKFGLVAMVVAGSWVAVGFTLSGCEMFFGDFVEGSEPQEPNPPATCAKTFRCGNTGDLEKCRIDQGVAVWKLSQECGAPMLCDQNQGACLTCAPRTYECVGDALRQCDGAGAAWSVVQQCSGDTPSCDPSTGGCEVCVTGVSRCDVVDGKHTRLQCSATPQGRVWSPNSCEPYPCRMIDGAAFCEQCTQVGVKGCVDTLDGAASTTVRECNADLRWVSTPCSDGFVCVEGACVLPPSP
jgi:hypothetical protein